MKKNERIRSNLEKCFEVYLLTFLCDSSVCASSDILHLHPLILLFLFYAFFFASIFFFVIFWDHFRGRRTEYRLSETCWVKQMNVTKDNDRWPLKIIRRISLNDFFPLILVEIFDSLEVARKKISNSHLRDDCKCSMSHYMKKFP